MTRSVLIAIAGLVLAGRCLATPPPRVRWETEPTKLSTSEAARLLAELERSVDEIAPRVPIEPAAPLRVAVEPDFVALAKRTNELSEVVLGDGRTVDLHLVRHADDGFAYRFGVARALLRSGGLARGEHVWLELGAALWLSGEWYGRPYGAWMADFAAAGALPTAEELMSKEPQPDGSRVLWVPVAAAVLERLPGTTAAQKLAAATPAAVSRELAWWAVRPAGPMAAAPPRTVPRLLGASLAMSNGIDSGYHAPTLDVVLGQLSELGFDAVSIMPFAFQPAADGPALRYLNRRPGSETDAGCIHAARRAHSRRLKVLWKPHLWVREPSWAGEVEMQSEEDWRAWWRGYSRYILHHAVLARWSGAEVFSIGVELDRTLVRRDDWRRLIAAVRRVYPGLLTYSGNWYEGFEKVPFWDRLDFVGVDAYFPLAEGDAASPELLARGARLAAERLAAVSKRTGKPIVLTEVGFAARRAAWHEPHREGGEYSEADQAASYRALLEALGGQRWLAGLFVWKAFSVPIPGKDGRPDFRFLGREAEAEIRAFLANERRRR